MYDIKELIQSCKDIKVLYVEDDVTVREQFHGLISIIFESIEMVVDGLEAIKKLEVNEYDLVITDISMPNVDGIELIEWINNRIENQKIIITSAYDAKEYLMKSTVSNVDGHLFKPVNMNALKEVLFKVAKDLKL
jgi:YesN/AraC family two-component response regulator